jgi:NitT/TauT family transport system substrate-binding protein
MKHTGIIAGVAAVIAALFAGCDGNGDRERTKDAAAVLRVGYFPNITHAPALIGFHATATKAADGWFEKATGAKVEWYPFNAGPSAIEALLADSIDVTYVGPNPVLNGYTRTKGADIRVLTGAVRGGSSLVIQPGSGLKTAADFRGKRIATPQLGNTQDVAARVWLKAGGLNITTGGGDAFVVPTQNPDQLDLFKRKELDAVWTVEPWVSRLELEASAELLLEDRESLTTLVATSARALKARPDRIRKFVAAHEALIAKIAAEPAWARPLVSAGLAKATTKPLPPTLLDRAWPRLVFTTDVKLDDFSSLLRGARAAGLLPEEASLASLFAKP